MAIFPYSAGSRNRVKNGRSKNGIAAFNKFADKYIEDALTKLIFANVAFSVI
jgi:hypothetical protein